MQPGSVVDRYLEGLEADTRRVADGQWGLSLDDVGGWPLHVGLRLDRGWLRAQGEVLGADGVGGGISDHELLFRNRGLVLVRYAHTGAGAVWVHGELAEELVSEAWLDRLLGYLVDAAIVARHRVASSS